MKDFFITSDTHLSHRNIIIYETRPFYVWKICSGTPLPLPDTHAMNETIIQRWNEVVGEDDLIFHLGDFAFASADRTREFVNRLNGIKSIILGNHDRARSPNWWREAGFEAIYKAPVDVGHGIVLSHEPLQDVPNGHINIHGHCHTKKPQMVGNKWINASIEFWDYRPILLSEILNRCKR